MISVILTCIVWLGTLKSFGNRFRIPKFTLEFQYPRDRVFQPVELRVNWTPNLHKTHIQF